ncbi:MAG TPA: DUF1552 domain-containing protein [Vicinamibacterales bacterium]|nr:DUF1552 domain-containing protein [Vicinamibacterales bacterium]
MFVRKLSLSRRTFLRGIGATLGLPLLDAMVPALTATERTAAKPQRRLGFVYVPHGVIMEQWTPSTAGADFAFTPILRPLERYRDSLVVVSNLARPEANFETQHAGAAASWLAGVPPKRTEGPDFQVGTTIDQVVAQAIGQDTTFPSLELATEDFTGLIGACSPGYSCAYVNTLNWQSPSTPLPMEINPRVVFERMFGQAGSSAQRLQRMQKDSSILDFVGADLADLKSILGPRDRARLGEYLDDVREVERRIQRAEQQTNELAVPNAPIGVPDAFEDHVGLMFDLLSLAYQADLTRVFTFMMAREFSQRTYPQVGVPEPHHTISHHGNNPALIEEHAKVNTYHASLFAKFLDRLKAVPDGDGTLLDHAMLVYGSGMSNGNGHTPYPLPHLIAGGAVKGNRHVVAAEHSPNANMHLSIAGKFGVDLGSFGVSTGTVDL